MDEQPQDNPMPVLILQKSNTDTNRNNISSQIKDSEAPISEKTNKNADPNN